ncbi:MAG TPA: penicillin-binding protein 2, partial [Patescibacteria group bacterium]|nr:penicillin-binding protein 2 [Patescibacteria group bacterium]
MAVKINKTSFSRRSSFLAAFLLLFFLGLAARLFYLEVVHGAQAREQADAQHSIYQKLFPSRGEIKLADKLSNDTIPLATNLKSYLVYAVPQDILNPSLTAASLAGALGLDQKDVLAKISNTDKKYVPLKKQLTDEEQDKIKALALPGIYFDSEDTRYYPENSLLSQTLGFVGYDNSGAKRGLYGLERYFDKDLAGTPGQLVAEQDTAGAWIFGATRQEQPAEDGVDLILTIDKTIQFQAESLLQNTVTKHGADSGSVIVADPKTGAILAMANYPTFDPNQYNKVADPAVFNNEAVTGNYEPGSVFKALTMAAALDEGKVTPDTTYTDTGSVSVDNFTIRNSDHKAHGVQTMTQVLDWSLNTGAIFAKDQLGNQDFYKYLVKFGFGQPTGIELPETKGDLAGLSGKVEVNYDTASFGQGILVTPIQMVQAYDALANGGKMMKPYLVQSKIYPDGRTVNTQPQAVSQVISPQTDSALTAMLIDVVENGYGKDAGVPGYYVAGKTGTAQVAQNGKYLENDNIGSFIGYAPADDPKFVMLIRI